MKFMLISPKNRTVYNFRGELVKEIIKKGYDVVVVGPDKIDVNKIYDLGATFTEISMDKNGTSVFGDIKYCYKLYKTIKVEQPDIVLGYTVKPVIYGAIASKLSGIKNINCMITGAGYTFTAKTIKAKVLGTIVRVLYKIGLKCGDHIIFQNKDDLEEFVTSRLVKKEKCYVVNGSGVDMVKFEKKPLPDKINFFMLSRLLKSKGVMEYLRAAEILKKKYPEVKFSLLGKYESSMQDAIEKEYVERLVNEGIIQRYEETSDVRPYYEKCSVYVLPSYREGTPRTVLEAMSMGRPIITTDANGCRDTVLDGVNGFLIPIKNVNALVEKMEYFICYEDSIKSFGEASINICKEKYDVCKVNEEMIKIMKVR